MIEINLRNLKENVDYYASSNKKIIGVVKNDAYGHGAVAISQALENLGLDYLFVNDLYEALSVVRAGVKLPVLIHNNLCPHEYHYLKEYPNLVVSLNSYQDYITLLADPKLDKIRVHIQIDTKMNRIGITDFEEFSKLLEMLKAHSKFVIEGIYTHFTSKDTMEEQSEKFLPYMEAYDFPMVHLAATDYAFTCKYGNYARIGMGLYNHKQLMTVKVKPIKIHHLEAGTPVGYYGMYVTKAKEYIAVLPLGYGDGYIRDFENFHVYCDGHLYPVVGRICMNHTFVKVDKYINLDSTFEILSPNLSANQLAKHAGKIPYQIYTMWPFRRVTYRS